MRLAKYQYAPLYGIIGTAVLAIAVLPLRNTDLRYLSDVVNNRGPLQYITIGLGLSIVSAQIMAHIKADMRSRLIIVMLALNLFPLLPGLTAYSVGVREVEAYYRAQMARGPSVPQRYEIERERATGYAVCSDCIFLSGLWMMAGIALTGGLWIRRGPGDLAP